MLPSTDEVTLDVGTGAAKHKKKGAKRPKHLKEAHEKIKLASDLCCTKVEIDVEKRCAEPVKAYLEPSATEDEPIKIGSEVAKVATGGSGDAKKMAEESTKINP